MRHSAAPQIYQIVMPDTNVALGRRLARVTMKRCRCNIDVMIRTQVQLPKELYEKARRFSREREMSLAEVVRRSLELFFDRYPAEPKGDKEWVLPVFDGGGILVPLEALKNITADDETFRSMPWLRKYD